MLLVRLVHWNHEEAQKRAGLLSAAGYEVSWEVPRGLAFLQELKRSRASAIVIDLERLPSQGRDLGLAIRKNNATRGIPLVFVGGSKDMTAQVRRILPDASFTSWGRIRSSVRRAISHPPVDPCVPDSVFAGYSGTPLPKKLGIKPGLTVGLIAAPQDFESKLGQLPEDSRLYAGARVPCDLLICFVRSSVALQEQLEQLAGRTDFSSVWFAWPKKASGVGTDLSEQCVRERGLAAGLVDYKICAIDSTWSGLLFARRKQRNYTQRHKCERLARTIDGKPPLDTD